MAIQLTEEDHANLIDKRVIITETGKPEPFEALVIKSSAMGTLVKPKGTSQATLVLADDIENIEYVATKPPVIKQLTLDPITEKGARRHLINQHGISLAQVNTIDEPTALAMHGQLPHEDAGHNHDGRKKGESDATTEAE